MSLIEDICDKYEKINIVNTARINTSMRLSLYAEKWESIFFWYNMLAVVTVILGIAVDNNKLILIVTSIFSLYVILLQYYVSTKNYEERSLRLFYHHLELMKLMDELKGILYLNEVPLDGKLERYYSVLDKYRIGISSVENHSEDDYAKGKSLYNDRKEKNKTLKHLIFGFEETGNKKHNKSGKPNEDEKNTEDNKDKENKVKEKIKNFLKKFNDMDMNLIMVHQFSIFILALMFIYLFHDKI